MHPGLVVNFSQLGRREERKMDAEEEAFGACDFLHVFHDLFLLSSRSYFSRLSFSDGSISSNRK